MAKALKNFFWPITDSQTREQLELFIKLSIVRGVHHSLVLGELVANYNQQFIKKNRFLSGVDLADEKRLIRQLKLARTPVSRVLLGRYREDRRLDGPGVPLFWTDGKRLVYNLGACKEFFRQRQSV